MYLEHLLQINMATLAALGALLLGMGQRSEGPPLLVVFAAVLSVWVTDIKKWFCLGQKWANVLMIVAAIFSLQDVLAPGNELQTVGFAWFLIYLQLVLLFQRKDERTYWLLVMLSLLQVMVATLFSQGVGFGLLLTIYMLLGFSAMTLLMIYRQHRLQQPVLERSRKGKSPLPILAHSTAAPAPSLYGNQRRWPLGQQSSELRGISVTSTRLGVTTDLFRRLGRMGLQTLAFSMVLFFALPRFGQVAWRGSITQPQPLIGFTDKVTLGELGQVIESPEEVMRVRFYRNSDGAPQPVRGEIYLRGAVLMIYEQGQWQMGLPSTDLGSQQMQRIRRLPPTGVVRQKITIESLDRSELFYIAPYMPIDKTNMNIDVDFGQLRLRRQRYLCNRRFEYTLGTTAIVDGVQRGLAPSEMSELTTDALCMPQGEGSYTLPILRRLAQEWIKDSGLPEQDKLARARLLERKFALSPQFRYSLAGQDRDPNIDPIEDFLSAHPRGHCEYFATALTLMLRSVGIPARMISGYKCDEWNEMGGYFQVRQLHAHTWVEAYLPPNQLPTDLLHGKDYWPWSKAGGWLLLDPTPTGHDDERSAWLAPARHAFTWLESAWSNYVVELDCQRQRDAIYQPIVGALKAAWHEMTSVERWHAMFHSLSVALYLDHLGREAKWIILGFLGLFLAAVLAGVVWLLGRWVRYAVLRRNGQVGGRDKGRRIEIEFYRRLESLLAQRGLVRTAGQTQREFAIAAGAHFAATSEDKTVATLPAMIADAFYRVRFGRVPLDSLQAEAVEHALVKLARENGSRPKRPRGSSGS